jgi:MoaA/NifB/PqqE/SkfB family radical SAM enzyme
MRRKENMTRLFRPDFLIEQAEGSLFLKNTHYPSVKIPVNPVAALVLALHDGIRNEDEIVSILQFVFKENYTHLKDKHREYERFLVPINKANVLFEKPWPSYNLKNIISGMKNYSDPGGRRPSPRFLSLYITNSCTRRCKYCYIDKVNHNASCNEQSLSLAEIKNILSDAFKLGIESVLLTGGEPFLISDTYEIINSAAYYNIKTQILTKHLINAGAIRNIDTSLLDLSLSIDSHKDDIANYLAGDKTFFDDMLKNMALLKSLNIPFVVSIVITKINIEHIFETVMYFLKNGACRVVTNHYAVDNPLDINNDLYLPVDDKIRFDQEWYEVLKSNGLDKKVTHKPYLVGLDKDSGCVLCNAGYSKLAIRFDGRYIFCEKLTYCGEIVLGTTRDISLLDMWESGKLLKYVCPGRQMYEGTTCYVCTIFETCKLKNACFYKSLKQHGTIYHPLSEVKDVCTKR